MTMDRKYRINTTALRVMKVLYDQLDGQHYGASLGRDTEIGNGTLYPILDKLETLGLITGEWETEPQGRRPRFFYRLTSDGIQAFETERNKLFGPAGARHA